MFCVCCSQLLEKFWELISCDPLISPLKISTSHSRLDCGYSTTFLSHRDLSFIILFQSLIDLNLLSTLLSLDPSHMPPSFWLIFSAFLNLFISLEKINLISLRFFNQPPHHLSPNSLFLQIIFKLVKLARNRSTIKKVWKIWGRNKSETLPN